MDVQILKLLAEHYEKQDLLSSLTEQDFIHGYGYSEIHCIDAIGLLDKPNVTKIAMHLKMTRGAASKITKKLLVKHAIEKYVLEGNKKEVYFRLTTEGEKLFQEHRCRHELWEKRDTVFFSRYSREELSKICVFFADFNAYLGEQIEQLSKEKREYKC